LIQPPNFCVGGPDDEHNRAPIPTAGGPARPNDVYMAVPTMASICPRMCFKNSCASAKQHLRRKFLLTSSREAYGIMHRCQPRDRTHYSRLTLQLAGMGYWHDTSLVFMQFGRMITSL
jgi:hypothetical protein